MSFELIFFIFGKFGNKVPLRPSYDNKFKIFSMGHMIKTICTTYKHLCEAMKHRHNILHYTHDIIYSIPTFKSF